MIWTVFLHKGVRGKHFVQDIIAIVNQIVYLNKTE